MARQPQTGFNLSLGQFLGRNISEEEKTLDLLNSPAFRKKALQRARELTQPGLESLKIEETESQRASKAGLRDLPEEILGQFSRRGLLRSGGASRALTEGIGGLQRQRALEKADIASRRSGLEQERAGLTGEIQQTFLDQALRDRELRAALAGDEARNRVITERDGRQVLLDINTGETIADLGPAGRGGGGGGGAGGDGAFNTLLGGLLGGGVQQEQVQQQQIPQFETLEDLSAPGPIQAQAAEGFGRGVGSITGLFNTLQSAKDSFGRAKGIFGAVKGVGSGILNTFRGIF